MEEYISKIFEELEKRYGAPVARYVRSIYFNEQRNLDFLQEAVCVIKRAEKTFKKNRGNFDKYVIRSIKNQLIRLKKEEYAQATPISQLERDDGPQVQFEIETPDPSELLEYGTDEAYTALAAAFSSLSPYELFLVYSVVLLKTSLTDLAALGGQKYYDCYKSFKLALLKLRRELEESRSSLEEIFVND